MQEESSCKSCGSPGVEEGYEYALCGSCRERLAGRPLPAWIKGVAAAVLIVFLFALVNLPGAMAASLAFDRGKAAARAGNYEDAVAKFEQVVKRFPGSLEARARLAIVYAHAGDIRAFAKTTTGLFGKEIPAELADEIDRITAIIEREMGE